MIEKIGVAELEEIMSGPVDIYPNNLPQGEVVIIKNPVAFVHSVGRTVVLLPVSCAHELFKEMQLLNLDVRFDPQEKYVSSRYKFKERLL